MKIPVRFLLLVVAALFHLVAAGFAAPDGAAASDLRRIVVFGPAVEADRQAGIVRAAGGREIRSLRLINAVAAVLPDPASEAALKTRHEVVRVDKDLRIQAHNGAPTIPWGVARIEAPFVWSETVGEAVRVAIVDTGIQRDHPDLEAVVMGGRLFITSPPYHRRSADEWDDDNGHGTHVAGTVAAYGGIAGVAPQAHLYAAKVLDKNGGGSLSSLIAALEWSIAEGMEVVNMSLGASSGNASFHDAIKAAHQAGLVLVASAGNRGPGDNTVSFPAAYPETIAVAASDQNDNIASWSSRGPEVDITGPGVSIFSTWIDNGYRTLSGTSMAAPHVSGTAALVIARDGAMNGDDMWWLLTASAEDLGHQPTAQGAGLVRADLALGLEVPPAPAFFEVVGLEPQALTVEPGSSFTVTAALVNQGDESATKEVAFQVDDDEGSLQTHWLELSGGESASVSFTAEAPEVDGSYSIIVWTEDHGAIGSLTVDADTGGSLPDVGMASVASINYSTRGGPNRNRHLDVEVVFVDGQDAPVSDASVTIALYRDGGLYAAASGGTGNTGAVSFSFINAPSGTYVTEVTGFSHSELEFDGVTPENSFTK